MTLRARLIRLAYAHPDIRGAVVPLLVSAASRLQWDRLPQGGIKYISPEIMAYVLSEEVMETVRDRNIPSWADVTNDGELFADGIPELVEAGRHAEREWEKWNQQGWWPKPVKVQKWRIFITHRPSKTSFESDLLDTMREAQDKAEDAIPRVEQRRRPQWLHPV